MSSYSKSRSNSYNIPYVAELCLPYIRQLQQTKLKYKEKIYTLKVIKEDIDNIMYLPNYIQIEYHLAALKRNNTYFVIKLTSEILDEKRYSVIKVHSRMDGIQFVFKDEPTKTIYLTTLYFPGPNHEKKRIAPIRDDATPVWKEHNHSKIIKEWNTKLNKTRFEFVIGNLYDVTKEVKNRNKKRPNIHSYYLSNMECNMVFNVDNKFYICIRNVKTRRCESCIAFDQPNNVGDDMVEIDTYTSESYRKLGLTKMLCACLFKVIPEQFPQIKCIITEPVNPIMAYLIIKYFKAKIYNSSETNSNYQKKMYNLVMGYIKQENYRGPTLTEKWDKQVRRYDTFHVISDVQEVNDSEVTDQTMNDFIKRMSRNNVIQEINRIENKMNKKSKNTRKRTFSNINRNVNSEISNN